MRGDFLRQIISHCRHSHNNGQQLKQFSIEVDARHPNTSIRLEYRGIIEPTGRVAGEIISLLAERVGEIEFLRRALERIEAKARDKKNQAISYIAGQALDGVIANMSQDNTGGGRAATSRNEDVSGGRRGRVDSPMNTHLSMWPPIAAVRHRSMATSTFRCIHVNQPGGRSVKWWAAEETISANSTSGPFIH